MRGNCAGTVWFRLPSLYKWSNLDIRAIGCQNEYRDLGLWYCASGPGLRFQQGKDEWVPCYCEYPEPWGLGGACAPNKHSSIHKSNNNQYPVQGAHIPIEWFRVHFLHSVTNICLFQGTFIKKSLFYLCLKQQFQANLQIQSWKIIQKEKRSCKRKIPIKVQCWEPKTAQYRLVVPTGLQCYKHMIIL